MPLILDYWNEQSGVQLSRTFVIAYAPFSVADCFRSLVFNVLEKVATIECTTAFSTSVFKQLHAILYSENTLACTRGADFFLFSE